jgi:putative redox protein
MSVKISAKYLGGKKMELLHEPSGTRLVTDAPVDNNGEGSGFSPTDMVAGALGSCMMTIMAIIAERDGIDLTGMRMEAEKSMTTTPPRRIAAIPVTIHLPAGLAPEARAKMEAGARACPVHKSLLPEIETPMTFIYDV